MNAIGQSSPSFCHDRIRDTAESMEEAGFDVWEIVAEGGHSPWENRKRFQKVLPSFQLKIQLHAPISDCNLGSLTPGAWRYSLHRVERAFRGAAAIGATRVTVHPGNHTPLSRDHYEGVHERTREALLKLDRLGRELGLELLLENMPLGWAFETESLEKLVDLTEGTSFGLCYDVGHAFVSGRLDEFETTVKRIRNVHIHDNKGDVDSHLTLGDGTVPWKRSVERLVRGRYRGTFVIESNNHASGNESRSLLQRQLDRFA